MLVFSQQLQDVVVLTWDDITVTEDLVTVRLGGFAIALNDLLIFRGASSWRSPVRTGPPPTRTAAASVFRGHSPGQHINAMSLRERLRRHVFSTRAARLGIPRAGSLHPR